MSQTFAGIDTHQSVHYPIKPEVKVFLLINVLLEVVVIGVVSLRLWSRKVTAVIGADDWLVVSAVVVSLGELILSGFQAVMGNGYDVAEVAGNYSTQLLMTFCLQPLSIFPLVLSKLSVCCFYLRVFVNEGMRKATFATMIFIVVWGVTHYLVGVFACSPVATQYDLDVLGTCIDQIALFQSLIVFNIILDIILMVLPMYTVWHLQMSRPDRLGLCAAFGIGIILVIASIIRIAYVSTVNVRGNPTGTMPISIFLTMLDNQLAPVCISIPMLRPLYMTCNQSKASTKLPHRDEYDRFDNSFQKHERPSGMSEPCPGDLEAMGVELDSYRVTEESARTW